MIMISHLNSDNWQNWPLHLKITESPFFLSHNLSLILDGFLTIFLCWFSFLAENPAAEEEDYRLEVLITLRKLERLDKEEYNDEEREEAEQIYEQRRQEELAAEVGAI